MYFKCETDSGMTFVYYYKSQRTDEILVYDLIGSVISSPPKSV